MELFFLISMAVGVLCLAALADGGGSKRARFWQAFTVGAIFFVTHWVRSDIHGGW